MAIVKMPLLSEKACGKIGRNLVFKIVHGHVIVSTRPSFKNKPRSERQIRVSSIFAELSRLYTTLTLDQLENWNCMVSYKTSTIFGIPRHKSPINSFVQVNFFRRDRSMPALMVPPSTSRKGNISDLSAVNKPNESGTVVLSWFLPPETVEQDAVDVWITTPFNTITRKPRDSDFHHLTYVPGNSTSVDITGLKSSKYYYFLARFVEEDGRVAVFHDLPAIQIE